MHSIEIREARIDDSALILRFINELATYEKEPEAVVATEADIRRSIFGADSTVDAIICLMNGEPIGFAVYFYNYSTWVGRNGMYLEDLYVSPEYRKFGAGKAILKHLAALAVARGCGRFEWSVLDWNEPAIGFYQSIGAKPMDGWTVYRLSGAALEALAER
ncbi:L-amino acid N-acyltransferase YncA [Marinobacterium halophilum]|uniref:L-amino acid N-acyltransferase YncA n=1 Tax=Marinobacterium halophilum TaxID=267374 RepID=A0A2P8F315_9GAMM|nr:GNAT family N-acetyltransferase [Marinobacterium halophilum]PSL16101.1 L-amino acid N-acyltransferase YncA [Marinobacterium halophilum]